MDAGACHELGRLQILVPHLEPTKIHVLSNTVLDFLQNQTSEPEYEVLLEHLKVRPQLNQAISKILAAPHLGALPKRVTANSNEERCRRGGLRKVQLRIMEIQAKLNLV